MSRLPTGGTDPFELDEFQHKLVNETRMALRDHQSVLIQAPTGAGKTVIATRIAKLADEKKHDIIFGVHRDFLIDQSSRSFFRAGVVHGVIASHVRGNRFFQTQIASLAILKNRIAKGAVKPPKIMVFDEAHHCTAASWTYVWQWAKDNGCKIIGLTATPWRLSGKGLKDRFEVMVKGPPVRWLIDNGYLSEYRIFAPFTPDLSRMHSVAGDYQRNDAEKVMMDNAIIGDVVKHYSRHAKGMRSVVFCVSIKHSLSVVERFRAAGIKAAHLDGTTPDAERRATIRAFADGDLDVLSNVELFGEGFDLSAIAGRDVPLEAVMLLRPTQSLTLFLQQVGRSLRYKEEPAIILDHAGNVMRHGLPDADFGWTLEDRKKRGSKDGGEQMVIRQCPECFFVHPIANVCPNCGHAYDTTARERVIEEREGDLMEIDKARVKFERIREQAEARTIEQLIDLAKRRKYKNPEKWAAGVFTFREQKTARRKMKSYQIGGEA